MIRGDREKEGLQARLSEKEKEISGIREALNQTNAKLENLDKELSLAGERQKKTAEQLLQATNINASLQESLMGLSRSLEVKSEQPPADSGEQKRADELEKKVRVILDLNESK